MVSRACVSAWALRAKNETEIETKTKRNPKTKTKTIHRQIIALRKQPWREAGVFRTSAQPQAPASSVPAARPKLSEPFPPSPPPPPREPSLPVPAKQTQKQKPKQKHMP